MIALLISDYYVIYIDGDFDAFRSAQGRIRLRVVVKLIEVDIRVISICGSKPLFSKT